MEIIFGTAQGQYELTGIPDWTIADLCWHYKIPVQSVSFYGSSSSTSDLELIVGQLQTLNDIEKKYSKLFIQPDRNINFSVLAKKDIKFHKPCKASFSAEYRFQNQIDEGTVDLVGMSVGECRSFVFKEVRSFLDAHPEIVESGSPIVMGISGGGDSNTFLDAFTQCKDIDKSRLVPVMMLGVPDWDLGKNRAIELCESYGLDLRFVEAETVTKLLGKKEGSDWVTDFEKYFPDADLEVLGTLCIRLSLQHVANELGGKYICTGLNLEDLLADSLFNIARGKMPVPFPLRKVNDSTELMYPLYRVPKKILDGCNPKYSLSNYQDRYPSMNYGRGVSYYLAQMVHNIAPSSEFDLLDGFAEISKQNTNYLNIDEDLGLPVLEPVPLKLRKQWKDFIGNS